VRRKAARSATRASARGDGGDDLVFKGLETVRTDWTPLAQTFQRELYRRVFKREPYQDFIRDYVRRTLAGEYDAQLIYRAAAPAVERISAQRAAARAPRGSPTNSTRRAGVRCSTSAAGGSAT
jgi:hypothetical protein